MSCRMDSIVQRCAAKISFNYLAWRVGPEFLLTQDFDQVRTFIRYGTLPAGPIVQISAEAVLADDSPTVRQTNGHLLTVDWPSASRKIIGQVSLFNEIKYSIVLAENCSAVWRDVRSGHHFDITQQCVNPLVAINGLYRGGR